MFEEFPFDFEVFSLDFDGCLACIRFLTQTQKDILGANEELLQILRQSSAAKIILVGSNRQDLTDDLRNSFADERGSCFTAINAIAAALDAQLLPLLLSDVYNNLPLGTSFNKALEYIDHHSNQYTIKRINEVSPNYNWIHDESKLTLLYAQLQLISLIVSDKQYLFSFFDDRYDLLEPLHIYFSTYPQLIPKNTTLQLKQYRGVADQNDEPYKELIHSFLPIIGTGETDLNFAQTIKNMAAVTIEQSDVSSSKSGKRITSYSDAKKVTFDLSAINVIKHFQPGMRPKQAPEDDGISGTVYAEQAKSVLFNRTVSIKISSALSAESTSPNVSPSYSWHSASSSMTSLGVPLSTSTNSTASSSNASSPRSILWQTCSKPRSFELRQISPPTRHVNESRNTIESPFALALALPSIRTRSREAAEQLIARPYLFFPAVIPATERKTTHLIGEHRNDITDLSKTP